MLSFTRLRNSSGRLFKAIVGVTREEFEAVAVAFTAVVEGDAKKQRERPGRRRQMGAGGKPALPDAQEQLLFILIYVKQYPTQDLLALLFGQTQPWACKWVHRLMPLLRDALGRECHLPLRHVSSVEELRARCPELQFIVDGTERPVARPSDEPTQRERYSGKKKRHTVKNDVLTSKKTKKIVWLSPTEPGSKHDKRIMDDSGPTLPPGSGLDQDTGFQGYAPAGVAVRQPKKKPVNGALTEEEKARNREISRERIGVEHSIGGMKVSRIAADKLRNRRVGFDDLVVEAAAGLHNLRRDTVTRLAA